MKTHNRKILQKLWPLSLSILFTFTLLSFTTKRPVEGISLNSPTVREQIKIVITKNTTERELEEIAQKMEVEGFFFKYSKLVYNDNNEIIAISIKYKDANNNSGNYSVSSKNPINNIVILSEGGQISVTSAGNSNQAFINQGGSIPKDAQQTQKDHRSIMEERMAQMEQQMAERRRQMNARRSEMEERMQRRMDSLREENDTRMEAHFKGEVHTIDKHTTSEELSELQQDYESKNILIRFDGLRRNENDEITRISITIDNQNGSISTSSFGNGKDAIKDISVAADANHTLMKSAE